jgi:hypothetical protein
MVCRTSAARQTRSGSLVPLSGQAEPDRPLALATSRNRPALGASSNEGDRDSGAQSNREGWLGKVREGGTRFLIRCATATDWGRRRRGAMPPERPHANLGSAAGGGEFA